ncbi:hypothetical protein H4R34_002868, partial [Dimargaris verticillata]
GNDPERLQHYLVSHMLYFVMPSLIAAYITNGKWQEVETLIGNVMGIERVRTWMAPQHLHRIDYYGFAMFVAAYIAADSEALPGFLRMMSEKPGVDLQQVLDCKPSSDRNSAINEIFHAEFGITFHHPHENHCRGLRENFGHNLRCFRGKFSLLKTRNPEQQQ